MRKRNESAFPEKKVGSLEEACARYSFGRNVMRKIAEDAGAVVRIGKCVRFNFGILDKYMDVLSSK